MASVHNEGTELLVRAILSLRDEEECRNFLEDLLTTRELLDLGQRILVASLLEEKLVCYADKFFSKSHPDAMYTPEVARQKVARFGEEEGRRFDALRGLFGE